MVRLPAMLRRVTRVVALGAVLIAASVPTASVKATDLLDLGCSNATGHRQDASHSGASCTTLPSSPEQQWSVTLAGQVSYPLIANGRVFVTTSSSTGEYGGWLYALDAATGENAWGPVPLTGTYYWSSLAYDAGTVFVNNFDGAITAFDAVTGAQRWAQRTEYFAGELVARNGIVYQHGAHAVHALSALTGEIVWTSYSLDGTGSSISVDDEGVYVAAGCSWYRLSLTTGKVVWSANRGCGGGGGGVTYPTATRVFMKHSSNTAYVFDKATGEIVGTYGGLPAFYGSTVYLANDKMIVAEDIVTLAPKFTAQLPAVVTTSPVVAGGIVYVGAGTNVYAVDGTSGQITWTGSVPTQSGGGTQFSSPTSDIAVGNGLLVVPAGNTLTAFGGLVLIPPLIPTPTTTTTTTTSVPPTTTTTAPENSVPVPRFGKFAQAKPRWVFVNGIPSVDSDGSIVKYEWRWGDGSKPSGFRYGWHQYKQAGWYLIRLTITDDKGATATRAIWFRVN